MISTLLVNQELYPLTEVSGRRYQEQFKNDYYVRFPSFFKPQAFELLCMEVQRRTDRLWAETDVLSASCIP